MEPTKKVGAKGSYKANRPNIDYEVHEIDENKGEAKGVTPKVTSV